MPEVAVTTTAGMASTAKGGSLRAQLAAFETSEQNGFLPLVQAKDVRLPAGWQELEALLSQLSTAMQDPEAFRSTLLHAAQAVLDPEQEPEEALSRLPWRQRAHAYHLLTMATNAYVWCAGAEQGLDTIPAPLSTLAHAAGRLLGIAPIATHYTVDMFNWNLRDPSLPPLADNIDILHSFTGTPDETWFYAVTTEIEYRGGVSLQHMLSAIEAAAKKDSAGVTAALHGVSASIEASQAALHRMHEHLDPDVFYNQIRIFLAGWRNNPNLPNGVVYAGVDHEQPQHYFGASAAQSPAIAALDVFLGVRHGTAGDASTAVEDPDKKTEVHYLQAMRHYMVERHRAFLSQLAIEREVLQHFLPESSQAARDAYAGVAAALKAFRDEHLRIVARFIINPARKVKGDGGPAERGTGGTELVQFLKDVRQDGYQRALSTLN